MASTHAALSVIFTNNLRQWDDIYNPIYIKGQHLQCQNLPTLKHIVGTHRIANPVEVFWNIALSFLQHTLWHLKKSKNVQVKYSETVACFHYFNTKLSGKQQAEWLTLNWESVIKWWWTGSHFSRCMESVKVLLPLSQWYYSGHDLHYPVHQENTNINTNTLLHKGKNTLSLPYIIHKGTHQLSLGKEGWFTRQYFLVN